MTNVDSYRVQGNPPPWTVSNVNRFIVDALGRIERNGGPLPPRFRLSLCPWGERNSLGGTPPPVQDVTHPRLRLVHFTGCGRPYLVALFQGEDAEQRQRIAMQHLPWSEHFVVDIQARCASLEYLDCTEDLWDEGPEPEPRTLRELFEQGELAGF
jgi:hypothetical protein